MVFSGFWWFFEKPCKPTKISHVKNKFLTLSMVYKHNQMMILEVWIPVFLRYYVIFEPHSKILKLFDEFHRKCIEVTLEGSKMSGKCATMIKKFSQVPQTLAHPAHFESCWSDTIKLAGQKKRETSPVITDLKITWFKYHHDHK